MGLLPGGGGGWVGVRSGGGVGVEVGGGVCAPKVRNQCEIDVSITDTLIRCSVCECIKGTAEGRGGGGGR